MSGQDRRSFRALVGDLWRETTWLVRLGIFLGLAAGVGVDVYVTSVLMSDGVSYNPRGAIFVTIFFIALGGFVGCFVGVVLDGLAGLLFRTQKKRGRRRRRRP